MKPCDYFDLCASHDWTFQFSEDQNAWHRGRAERAELSRLAAEDEALAAIYRAWHLHVFSGPGYGTERAPRPERPIPVSTFPGAIPALVPGQLDLF